MTSPISPTTPFKGLPLDLALASLVVAAALAVAGLMFHSNAACPHAAPHHPAITASSPLP